MVKDGIYYALGLSAGAAVIAWLVSIKEESPTTTRISIFLNIFDVHVNRAPITGRIIDIQYHQGEFLVASKEQASAVNEQNVVTLQGDGTRVVFKQIAGLIARRIVFDKKLNQPLTAGERVGMIKFGSRVDVILGPEWLITAIPGQRVQAGASILAVRREG
jgi:phosphatidylserine decarboxylase